MGKWTAARVLGLLEARYPAPEWAFVANLRSHVGFRSPGRESYLDAFAMRCFPSKGLTRVAFEVKVARSDWLAELRDPRKRANGMRLSHEFWFVAPSGVVKMEEVPEGCGLLQATEGGLRTKRAAPYREAESMPEEFVEGNIRDSSFTEIWNDPSNFLYNRKFTRETATGACHDCRYLPLCRGGCATTSVSATGERANNPYCMFQIEQKQGIEPVDDELILRLLEDFQ